MTGGVHLRRPNRLERTIVHVYNRIACALFGHYRILENIPETWENGTFPCPHCCARLSAKTHEAN